MKKWIIWLLLVGSGLSLSERNYGTFSIAYQKLFSDLDSSTGGIIVRSDRDRIGNIANYLGYEIDYKYMVQGEEFIGSLVNYKGVIEDAKKVLERYPVDKRVIVYYDSSEPDQAVLEKSSIGRGIWGQLFVIFICVPLLSIIALKYVFVD